MNPAIFPFPRELEETGPLCPIPAAPDYAGEWAEELAWGWERLGSALGVELSPAREAAGAWVRVGRDAALARPEEYRVAWTPAGVEVLAGSATGALRGLTLLAQVARGAFAEGVRGFRCHDWPDFERRGFMLDISRCRIPTMETFAWLLDAMADWKLNELQLYIEHTFAYADHRTAWEGWSPITAEEVRALDAMCAARGIDLVPNQNSFGHLERWFEHPRYLPLAECEGGAQMPWAWSDRPGTIAPGLPESRSFLMGLWDELLPNFRSRFFNIGCDETYDLGQGKSKADVEARGFGAVWLEHVRFLCREAEARGRTPMFWADMLTRHHPELLGEVPRGAVAVEWGYEADYPFEERCAPLAEAGLPFYVAPSTNTFSTLAGHLPRAMANIERAAEAGRKFGARGVLTTNWGDNGNWEHLAVSMPALAWAAGIAWCAGSNGSRERLPAALCAPLGDAGGRAAIRLTSAAALCSDHGWFSLGRPYLAADAPLGDADDFCAATREGWRRGLDALLEIRGELVAASERAASSPFLGRLVGTADLAIHACHLAVGRIESGAPSHRALPEGMRQTFLAEFLPACRAWERDWLAESRRGGLSVSRQVFDRLAEGYRSGSEPA